jgi:hypothetical protein
MEKIALCISCLNGEWTAAGFRKGAPAGTWHSPVPIDEFAICAPAFRESFAQTQADGRTVGIVLAHPRLTDQVVDVPPVKGSKFARYLDRRVQQIKTFEGDAAWSHQRAMPAKGSDSVLVHLFPKAMLDQLGAACKEAGGQLVRVIPSTTVLATQLKELPIEKEQLALIAAETGSSITIIIGKRDGRVCLGRVLRGSWNTHADRVAVDLMRTIGFAEQQTGLMVSSVWLFGAGAAENLPKMQTLLRPALQVSPVEYTPFYWADQARKLGPKEDGNLVAPEVREAPQRRRFLTLTSASLLFMLVAALVVAGITKGMLQADRETVRKLDADIARWRNSKATWQAKHIAEARKRDIVRLVTDDKPLPVPGWFLGYLGEATPSDLLLTKLDVQMTNDAWSVRINGTAQPSTNDVPVNLDSVVGELTTNLANGPFHMKITRNSVAELRAAASQPPGQTPPAPAVSFTLEGVIR